MSDIEGETGIDLRLLLTPEQAADALAVGRTKLYELVRAGAIRSVRIDRCRRIPVAALEEYIGRLQDSRAAARS
jgi:excisionase family DNA binding protein